MCICHGSYWGRSVRSSHLNVSVDDLVVVEVFEPLQDLFSVEDDGRFVVFQRTPFGAQERRQASCKPESWNFKNAESSVRERILLWNSRKFGVFFLFLMVDIRSAHVFLSHWEFNFLFGYCLDVLTCQIIHCLWRFFTGGQRKSSEPPTELNWLQVGLTQAHLHNRRQRRCRLPPCLTKYGPQ